MSDNRADVSSAVDEGAPRKVIVLSTCCRQPMTGRADDEGAGEFFCCSACGAGFYFHF